VSAPQPILVGYFSRQVVAAPKPPTAPPHVEEVCSAGHCGGCFPEGWLELWLHNVFWLYDTEVLAWAVATQTENLRRLCKELQENWDGIPGSSQAAVNQFIARHIPPPDACSNWERPAPRWKLFAYRLFPTLFVVGKPEPIRFPPLELGPLPPDYERIGYDAVSVGAPRPEEIGLGDRFFHSSLSPFCNGRCQDIPVNRFCLLDTEEDGLRRAQEFSAGGGEPEPYVAVEVWRKRSKGS
jgi:hypothetical protein